ncbi:hypothetical protein PQQ51_28855 [Paraburkholderia xenovorans]|uniref:hypothetical protein n=1 Tax=Paraburkholderia xenovorans TaxID=36873 RepID=UPI0038B9361C
MNITRASSIAIARSRHRRVVVWCIALACAVYAYGLLEPAATARANLAACVSARLAPRDHAFALTEATPTARSDRDQAFSAALYACSTQP